MATQTSIADAPAVPVGRRGRRSVNTLPLLSPSVILLFLWMIVPLAMTLWFSFQYYNLLDPTTGGFAGWDNYTYLLDRPVLVDGDDQHAVPGVLGAGDHGRPRHPARRAVRSGILRPRRRAPVRDRAVLRDADGQRADLEEHADAPGERRVRLRRALARPAGDRLLRPSAADLDRRSSSPGSGCRSRC